jgi:hypothetical protein
LSISITKLNPKCGHLAKSHFSLSTILSKTSNESQQGHSEQMVRHTAPSR